MLRRPKRVRIALISRQPLVLEPFHIAPQGGRLLVRRLKAIPLAGAMYEAKPYSVKDCYHDAQLYFSHAIAAAKLAGLADEVERLKSRVKHIRNVYAALFRDVGG